MQSQVAAWQANGTALQSQVTKLGNQTTSDAKQLSSLLANVTSAEAQIASLQSTISSDKTQILSLQNANSTAGVQIKSLEANTTAAADQIAALQANATSSASQISVLIGEVQAKETDIGSLETSLASDQGIIYEDAIDLVTLNAAFVSGNFTETATCPVSSNCSYSINGVYANFGTFAANNATVTFTFYSQAAMAGQTLCTTTVALGNVSGRAVAILPQATCPSGSSTPSLSFGWTFAHH